MAVIIDLRPKLEKWPFVLLVLGVFVLLFGIKGCSSDEIKNSHKEVTTKVKIIDRWKCEGHGHIAYEVDGHEGELLVSDGTYDAAYIGKHMHFDIAPVDYKNTGETWYGLSCVVGGVLVIVGLFTSINALIDRYGS